MSDLLIVGAGTAGMTCAIVAAQAGADVVVVEKSDVPGGTLHLTGGHMSAAGTRRQAERGIDDSPEAHLADLVRISRGTVDERIAGLAVAQAAPTVEWLEEHGLELEEDTPAVYYGHEPYATARTIWGDDRGRSILRVLQPMWDEQVAAGRIAFLPAHDLQELLVEDGAVTGVVAGHRGVRVELRAAATVLATGGYAANLDLLADVTPGRPRALTSAAPTSQGDGILAAQRIGARFHRAERFLASIGSFVEDPEAARAFDSPQFMDLDRDPQEIWVNVRGERFTPEDVRSPDLHERALAAQPGAQMWVVCDDRALDADGGTFHRVWDAERLRAEAQRGSFAWSAPDLATLAARAGLDAGGLEQTVAAFNAAVASGEDPLGRTALHAPLDTPPFHAFRSDATVFVSFGGLAVDEELRVLDDAGRPIPGLHAAGEIIGAGTTSGNAFCSGMLLTPALAFGRLLGLRLTGTDTREGPWATSSSHAGS
jgi:fumarate reductase flavoprotein subunit